jgi:hypothetical protein
VAVGLSLFHLEWSESNFFFFFLNDKLVHSFTKIKYVFSKDFFLIILEVERFYGKKFY